MSYLKATTRVLLSANSDFSCPEVDTRFQEFSSTATLYKQFSLKTSTADLNGIIIPANEGFTTVAGLLVVNKSPVTAEKISAIYTHTAASIGAGNFALTKSGVATTVDTLVDTLAGTPFTIAGLRSANWLVGACLYIKTSDNALNVAKRPRIVSAISEASLYLTPDSLGATVANDLTATFDILTTAVTVIPAGAHLQVIGPLSMHDWITFTAYSGTPELDVFMWGT